MAEEKSNYRNALEWLAVIAIFSILFIAIPYMIYTVNSKVNAINARIDNLHSIENDCQHTNLGDSVDCQIDKLD